MGVDVFLLIAAGALAGGFANGLAGFGTGLFALGWWLAAMPPIDAVVTVVIMSLIGGLQGLYAVRNAIELGDQVRFLVPASIGIVIGYLCLELINIILLKLLVAGLLIMFGGFFAFRKKLPNLKKRYPSVPIIAFPREAGNGYKGFAKATGANCIAVDNSIKPEWAARHLQIDSCIQGNLNPAHMVTGGNALIKETKEIIETLSNGPHIFNLGHGITPNGNPDNVKLMIDIVRNNIS